MLIVFQKILRRNAGFSVLLLDELVSSFQTITHKFEATLTKDILSLAAHASVALKVESQAFVWKPSTFNHYRAQLMLTYREARRAGKINIKSGSRRAPPARR